MESKYAIVLVVSIAVSVASGFAVGFLFMQAQASELELQVTERNKKIADNESRIESLNNLVEETRNDLSNARTEIDNLTQNQVSITNELNKKEEELTKVSQLYEDTKVELLDKEAGEELYLKSLQISNTVNIKLQNATYLLTQAGNELLNNEPMRALTLIKESRTMIHPLLESQSELIATYEQMSEKVSGIADKEIIEKSTVLAKADYVLMEESLYVADGFIPLVTTIKEIDDASHIQSGPTRAQIERWTGLLNESETKFESALAKIDEANKIQPELELLEEKQIVSALLDFVKNMKLMMNQMEDGVITEFNL